MIGLILTIIWHKIVNFIEATGLVYVERRDQSKLVQIINCMEVKNILFNFDIFII